MCVQITRARKINKTVHVYTYKYIAVYTHILTEVGGVSCRQVGWVREDEKYVIPFDIYQPIYNGSDIDFFEYVLMYVMLLPTHRYKEILGIPTFDIGSFIV